MHFMIHGFGSFPMFFFRVIKYARQHYPDIQWSGIFPTYHYTEVFRGLLGDSNVLYLQDELNKYANEDLPPAILSNYHGNIYRDIESDQVTIKLKHNKVQEKDAFATYLAYKKFIERLRPTHILFSHVESHEGMILQSIAKELGIKMVYSCHSRNLGESFFSPEVTEKLPPYAEPDPASKIRANEFLLKFQEGHISANSFPTVVAEQPGQIDEIFRVPLWRRVLLFAEHLYSERHYQNWVETRVRFQNNLPLVRNGIWAARTYLNGRVYDIKELEDLPPKYIFYPLQYTPESSINVPAPFFLDQRRIIDIVRFSMPSDTVLIVKEHPNCITVRSGSFIRSLRKMAGVRIAYYKMNTRELIKRAQLTISVTGTAAWEAFLLGKASIMFGDTFFTELIGGKCSSSLEDARQKIRANMGRVVPWEERIEAMARIYNCTHPWFIRSPESGLEGKITMSELNVKNYTDSLLAHVAR